MGMRRMKYGTIESHSLLILIHDKKIRFMSYGSLRPILPMQSIRPRFDKYSEASKNKLTPDSINSFLPYCFMFTLTGEAANRRCLLMFFFIFTTLTPLRNGPTCGRTRVLAPLCANWNTVVVTWGI